MLEQFLIKYIGFGIMSITCYFIALILMILLLIGLVDSFKKL